MGKLSRTKGAAGEREVVRLFKDAGFTAQRTAPLQAAQGATDADVLVSEVPGLHIEVKRDEKKSVDSMLNQTQAEAGDKLPLLAYRRNGTRQWNAVVPLDHYAKLLGYFVLTYQLSQEDLREVAEVAQTLKVKDTKNATK